MQSWDGSPAELAFAGVVWRRYYKFLLCLFFLLDHRIPSKVCKHYVSKYFAPRVFWYKTTTADAKLYRTHAMTFSPCMRKYHDMLLLSNSQKMC